MRVDGACGEVGASPYRPPEPLSTLATAVGGACLFRLEVVRGVIALDVLGGTKTKGVAPTDFSSFLVDTEIALFLGTSTALGFIAGVEGVWADEAATLG